MALLCRIRRSPMPDDMAGSRRSIGSLGTTSTASVYASAWVCRASAPACTSFGVALRSHWAMMDLDTWWSAGRRVALPLGDRQHELFVREGGAGPALLLLHGFPASSYEW